MPGPNPYQYQVGPADDPVTLSSQFGVTPQQLLAANPGGAPFSVGQTINVPMLPPLTQANINQRGRGATGPYQYAAPASLGVSGTASLGGPVQRPPVGYGPNALAPAVQPTGYGTDDSWYRPPTTATTPNAPVNQLAAPGTTPNTSGGDFYGYERDPETGRSVRVIKNSSTSNFLKELRWDPQRRRYVSIGSLLRSGRLDIKGNWRGKRRGGGGGQARKQQQEQNKQDFSLSNSLISFGGSSG
jgi:hypothetical protein